MPKYSCFNKNDISYKEIEDALFPGIADLILNKNNGHPIDKAPNGESSLLFEDLLESTGSRPDAIRAKSHIYSSKYYINKNSLDENGEPTSDQLDRILPKKEPKSINSPKIKLYQKSKINPLINDKITAPNSKSIIEGFGVNSRYSSGYPKGSNKRAIAAKFFRYSQIGQGGLETSPPHYPYRRSEDRAENIAYKDYVNSHYTNDVVEINDRGVITFLPKVEEPSRKNPALEIADSPVEDQTFGDIFGMEEVDVSHLDTATDRIQKRLSLLERRVSKTGGTPGQRANIVLMKKQIEAIDSEKKELVTPDILENTAFQDANVIKSNLENIEDNVNNIGDMSDVQILNLLDTLVENSYNIKGWIDIQEVLKDVDVKSSTKLNQLSGVYSGLNIKYNDLLAELFTEYANRKSYRSDFSKKDILKAVADVPTAKLMTSGLGEANVDLLRITDDVIKQATFNINTESIKKANKVKKWVERLKDDGFSEKEVSEILQQKDSNNKWTGNIVGEVAHKYYAEKNEQVKKAKKSSNWRKYYNWIKDNSVILNRKQLIDITKGDYSSSETKGYSKNELDLQKDLLSEYELEKDAYREVLTITYGDSESAINEDLLNWERAHSPYMYAQGENNDGYRFLIKEKPDLSKYSDKNFEKIKSNPVLMEFYNFMINRFDENNKSLGYFNEFDEIYLPEKEASLLERTKTQKGVWGKLIFLNSELKGSFTDEIENINDETIDIRGRTIKGVPIQMMQNKIPAALKEANVFQILDSHTNMSLNYKYKTGIEPMTNAATDLLDSMKEIEEIDIDGKKVPKKGSRFSSEKEGQLVNAKKALEFAKDAYLYNNRKDVEGRIKTVGIKELVEDEKGEIVLEKKKKDITASSIVDNLITYTYLKAMSLPNIVTPAVNMMFGINSNLTYAAAGEDVTLENIRKAMLQMMAVTAKSFGGGSNNELVNKVYAFMERFQVLGTIHDSDYGKGKSTSEMITILQSKAEYFNQGSLMLGMLYTQNLKDKNGNTVSMFDAYEVKDGSLVWNSELMGVESKVPNDRVVSEDLNGVNLFNFGKHLDKVNATVHGDYKTAMLAKKSSVGRILMLFKTWLPKAIDHRFGVSRFDKDLMDKEGGLGRDVKGRYRSIFSSTTLEGQKVLIADTIKMMLHGMVSRKAFNQLSDVDRVNMMRNLKEIKQVATVYLTIALLKAMFMDEDDDFKPGLNLAINTLTKTGSDLSFFVSPNSASQVLDNLVSVSSTLKDIERAISAVYKTVQGDFEVKSGPQAGYNRISIGAARTIPGFSGGLKMWNLGSKVIDY